MYIHIVPLVPGPGPRPWPGEWDQGPVGPGPFSNVDVVNFDIPICVTSGYSCLILKCCI